MRLNVYDPGSLERNHERYIWEGRVAAASAIDALVRPALSRQTGAPTANRSA